VKYRRPSAEERAAHVETLERLALLVAQLQRKPIASSFVLLTVSLAA
jgi:hypothetical protein